MIFGVYFFDANLFVVVIDLDTKKELNKRSVLITLRRDMAGSNSIKESVFRFVCFSIVCAVCVGAFFYTLSPVHNPSRYFPRLWVCGRPRCSVWIFGCS